MSSLKFSCMSKTSTEHHIEWTDGLTAVVTGSWVKALSVAQGRSQHDALEKLQRRIEEDAANLQAAAHRAEHAAEQMASAVSECRLRERVGQRQSKARDE